MPNYSTRSRLPSGRTEPIEGASDSMLTQQLLLEPSESHHSPLPAPDTYMASHTVSPHNTPEVNQVEYNPFSVLPEEPDFDTMLYPYPHYTDGPDAEPHIRAFLLTWQTNHST